MRIRSTISNEVEGEAGRLTVLAMIFCIVAIAGYLKVGQFILPKMLAPNQLTLLLLLVGTITLFTIGGVIHTILMGEKSPRQLRRELRRQIKLLSAFVAQTKERIADIEGQIGYRAGLFRPVAYDQLTQLRQLIFALERRVTEVEFLIASRRRKLLYRAAQVMGSDLFAVESCLDQLIDARPLPPMRSEEWIPNAERLLAIVEEESKRAQSLRAA